MLTKMIFAVTASLFPEKSFMIPKLLLNDDASGVDSATPEAFALELESLHSCHDVLLEQGV